MSYHLEMEKTGKVPKIDMPPIAEQPVQQQAQPKVQQPQEQYDVHPDIAKEYVQPIEAQEPVQPEEHEQEVEAAAEPEPAPEPVVKETAQAKNFRQIKQQKEKAERERDELMRKLHEIEMAKYQQKPEAPKEEEKEPELDNDDWVPAKYLKKYDKTVKELQEELRSYKQQTNISSTDAKLKARFPDLDKVVSRENLETLREEYPELADSINATPDLYNKAVSAYTLIKKLGIAQEDVYLEDRQRAQKNAAKPRPLASVSPQQGDSPLSKANAFANGLTDELKTQLRKEMEAARKAL